MIYCFNLLSARCKMPNNVILQDVGLVNCIVSSSILLVMNGTLLTLSCTPHFKDDAERPWITQESITSVSLWFNPDGGSTLEDIAETIENFVQTMPGYSNQIASCSLQSLTISMVSLSVARCSRRIA